MVKAWKKKKWKPELWKLYIQKWNPTVKKTEILNTEKIEILSEKLSEQWK